MAILYSRMMNEIQGFQSNEDALDYFQGYRSFLKSNIQKSTERLDSLIATKAEIDSIISAIEGWNAFDINELKRMLNKIRHKLIERE